MKLSSSPCFRKRFKTLGQMLPIPFSCMKQAMETPKKFVYYRGRGTNIIPFLHLSQT